MVHDGYMDNSFSYSDTTYHKKILLYFPISAAFDASSSLKLQFALTVILATSGATCAHWLYMCNVHQEETIKIAELMQEDNVATALAT